MPIRNFPFLRVKGSVYRPWLPITITNPHTTKSISMFALVDTGADDCVMPAQFARILGHNFKKGIPRQAGTAKGKNHGFCHTTKIDIVDLQNKILYTIDDTPIAFMPGLNMPLLGVKNFLDNFDLHVFYPDKNFSIKYPAVHSSP